MPEKDNQGNLEHVLNMKGYLIQLSQLKTECVKYERRKMKMKNSLNTDIL